MELKALPEGSRPTRRQSWSPTLPSASVSANTLEQDWVEKGNAGIAAGDQVAVRRDDGDTEMVRRHAGEAGNVGRNLAALALRRHGGDDPVDDGLEGAVMALALYSAGDIR